MSTPAQRTRLALETIRFGVAPEKACAHLTWQEFESFVESVLSLNGYETVKHHRLERGRSRAEIDILGLGGRILLAIDCKHWSKPSGGFKSRTAVEAQIVRVRALCAERNIKNLASKFGGKMDGEVSVLPVVATLHQTRLRIHQGVPVVPVFQLGDFLYELPSYIDCLSTFPLGRPPLFSKDGNFRA